MPFDNRPEQSSIDTFIIDRMLNEFGPNGENWTAGEYADDEGNRCITGALTEISMDAVSTRIAQHVDNDPAAVAIAIQTLVEADQRVAKALRIAIAEQQGDARHSIVSFNDTRVNFIILLLRRVLPYHLSRRLMSPKRKARAYHRDILPVLMRAREIVATGCLEEAHTALRDNMLR